MHNKSLTDYPLPWTAGEAHETEAAINDAKGRPVCVIHTGPRGVGGFGGPNTWLAGTLASAVVKAINAAAPEPAAAWTTAPPTEGELYWVTNGKNAWPMYRVSTAAGGWSNDDTDEDFDHEIIAWQEIEKPALPA